MCIRDRVDAAMQAITSERLGYTRRLLAANLDKLHQLAALLLEHESLDADSIRAALGLTLPALSAAKLPADRQPVSPTVDRAIASEREPLPQPALGGRPGSTDAALRSD